MERSERSCLGQTNSLAVVAKVRYSASADDWETVTCFLAFQETNDLPRNMQKPATASRIRASTPISIRECLQLWRWRGRVKAPGLEKLSFIKEDGEQLAINWLSLCTEKMSWRESMRYKRRLCDILNVQEVHHHQKNWVALVGPQVYGLVCKPRNQCPQEVGAYTCTEKEIFSGWPRNLNAKEVTERS